MSIDSPAEIRARTEKMIRDIEKAILTLKDCWPNKSDSPMSEYAFEKVEKRLRNIVEKLQDELR